MKIASDAFENNGYLPARYSKKGDNVSPTLNFVDVSNEAKSLALICYDIDAVGGFTHWLIWGIDPKINVIKEGALPLGAVEGMSDWNFHNWGGPQPPSGTHRYEFRLYALDTILNLPANAIRNDLESAMNGHVIDKAIITGLFKA